MNAGWLSHVPKFILQIIDFVLSLNFLFQFGNYLPEKDVDNKRIDRSFVIHVKHSPEIVQSLG